MRKEDPHFIPQPNAFPCQFHAKTRPLAQFHNCRIGRRLPFKIVRVGT